MSFAEYLKLIPKGIANADKIVEGMLTNLKLEKGDLPEDQVQEIIKRRLLCAGCPFMSENAKKITGLKTSRDSFCTLCSCPIKGKTASLSSTCGADYYNKTHPDKPQEYVRWEQYSEEPKREGADSST